MAELKRIWEESDEARKRQLYLQFSGQASKRDSLSTDPLTRGQYLLQSSYPLTYEPDNVTSPVASSTDLPITGRVDSLTRVYSTPHDKVASTAFSKPSPSTTPAAKRSSLTITPTASTTTQKSVSVPLAKSSASPASVQKTKTSPSSVQKSAASSAAPVPLTPTASAGSPTLKRKSTPAVVGTPATARASNTSTAPSPSQKSTSTSPVSATSVKPQPQVSSPVSEQPLRRTGWQVPSKAAMQISSPEAVQQQQGAKAESKAGAGTGDVVIKLPKVSDLKSKFQDSYDPSVHRVRR